MKKNFSEYIPFWNLENNIPVEVVASVYRKYDATSIFDLAHAYYNEVLGELSAIADDFE